MNRAIFATMEEQIPHLRRYARSLTRDADRADDLVQDALERAISRIDKFKEGTNLRSWMFTIMHNVFIDQCRRTQRRGVQVPLEEWTSGNSQNASQDLTLEVRDVEQNLGHLRPSEREVIELVTLQGLKYEDAAARLEVAVGTVKSRLFRARENLKEMHGYHS